MRRIKDRQTRTHIFSFLLGLDLSLGFLDSLAEEDDLLDLALGLESSSLKNAGETFEDLLAVRPSLAGNSFHEGMLEPL